MIIVILRCKPTEQIEPYRPITTPNIFNWFNSLINKEKDTENSQKFQNKLDPYHLFNVNKKGKINIILKKIKNNYLDDQYYFNKVNLPHTIRYPDKSTIHIDTLYLKNVKRDIVKWNNILNKSEQLAIDSIKLLEIVETEAEYLLKVLALIKYGKYRMYLKLKYYGKIDKADDFFDGRKTKYSIKLVDIKSISEETFDNLWYHYSKKSHFMSLDQQLEYVKKIDKMHEEENKWN